MSGDVQREDSYWAWAGYAQAERDIIAWLKTKGPTKYGCRWVEHIQEHCSCFDVIRGIEAEAHRNPEGGAGQHEQPVLSPQLSDKGEL